MNVRELVKGIYPHSKRWAQRVDQMEDKQVVAIWYTHQRKQMEQDQTRESAKATPQDNQDTLF